MTLTMNLGENSYDIIIEPGCIHSSVELLNLDRRVLIVTDDGVPIEYAKALAAHCKMPTLAVLPQGEGSKSIQSYESLLKTMLSEGFTRSDCVVAVGGGVIGDLSGFAAASYMRGIDFYNIPTTVLSQVDSSIGGKTALNLGGIKNIVGAFYQPKRVLIDTELLKSLSPRQCSNGLAEALKMSMTSDKELFEIFEKQDIYGNLDIIIQKSLMIKKDVVERDEKEQSLRRVLNFGHTIGHGIESFEHLNGLYHGECVALGMLPMCSESVRSRLLPVLQRLNLPTSLAFDPDEVFNAMLHDKKAGGNCITAVFVNDIGAFELKKVPMEDLRPMLSVIMEKSV